MRCKSMPSRFPIYYSCLVFCVKIYIYFCVLKIVFKKIRIYIYSFTGPCIPVDMVCRESIGCQISAFEIWFPTGLCSSECTIYDFHVNVPALDHRDLSLKDSIITVASVANFSAVFLGILVEEESCWRSLCNSVVLHPVSFFSSSSIASSALKIIRGVGNTFRCTVGADFQVS